MYPIYDPLGTERYLTGSSNTSSDFGSYLARRSMLYLTYELKPQLYGRDLRPRGREISREPFSAKYRQYRFSNLLRRRREDGQQMYT